MFTTIEYFGIAAKLLVLTTPPTFLVPSAVQHWDLNEMGYIETMFGHQSEINAIDSWRKERVVTGGRDRTVGFEQAYCSVLEAPRG